MDDLKQDAPSNPSNPTRPLLAALLRPNRSQLLVALVLAIIGFAVVTQVRTNTVDDTYAGLREQDLIDILNGLADTTQRATVEIQRLETTRDDLASETSALDAALEATQLELDALTILAGTVPVTGPGVLVRIEEVAGPVGLEPFIDMVQALRSAGAEAMSINGEVRVVASTSFIDVAGGLVVDGKLLTAPFTVQAIGSPAALRSALQFPSGPEDQIERDGQGELSVTEVERMEITTIREIREPGVAASPNEQ
jgi:uncharacterized protein YlxW (UPF0749 family)